MARRHLIASVSIIVVLLTFFGVIMVGNSSVVTASRDFSDKWYYLKLQIGWSIIGLLSFIFFSRFPHKKLEAHATLMFFITLVMLVAVLIPGLGSKRLGARRWLNLGPLSFQPAELAKLTSAIYLSTLVKKKPKLLPFVFSVGLVGGLVMLEPDLGTSLVIVGMGILVYLGGGGKVASLLGLIPVSLLLIVFLIVISPYRLNRLLTFFDHSKDPLGASYQIRQALIGIGSGGIAGVGLGQSRQKYEFLPEVSTDSIFAVIGEEFGLIGTTCILGIFLLLIIYGIKISAASSNQFSANLSLAITSAIGVQALLNISAITALVPLTGIPLSYISYGGSSLVILLIASGILVNIAKG